MQNGDILVPANPVPPGKMVIELQREREREREIVYYYLLPSLFFSRHCSTCPKVSQGNVLLVRDFYSRPDSDALLALLSPGQQCQATEDCDVYR